MWSRKRSLLSDGCSFICVVVISLLTFTEFQGTVCASYIGCYKQNERGPELMKGYRQDFPNILTTEKCISVCAAVGFAYAGVQNGTECYCDNRNPPLTAVVSDGECSFSCPGNVSEYCGGESRISAFTTGLSGDEIVNTYIGCYKENESGPRLMKGFQKNFRDSMTPQICINMCYSKGFRYAGVQFQIECFCDNVKPPLTKAAEEVDCSMKCPGDSNQICGGGWRISLYETGVKGPPSEAVENYVGCFKDEEKRLLDGYLQKFPDNLTPERCVGLCYRMGFLYAGLEYSTECFCGDKHPSPLILVPEGECQEKCSGDINKNCGGNWRLSVYETTITDIPEAGKLIGCYIDARNNRVLNEFKIDLFKTNSPRRCLNLCLKLGYLYSGVEYGRECFCGNKRPDEVGIVGDDNCNLPCPGDPGQICGGNWRIYAFRTGIETEAKHCALDTIQPSAMPEIPAKVNKTELNIPDITIPIDLEPEEGEPYVKPEITKPMDPDVPQDLNVDNSLLVQASWKHIVKVVNKPLSKFQKKIIIK